MQMYKDAVITKNEVTDAITILENNPIQCVTFAIITDDLLVDWIKDAIKSKEGCN